VTGHRHKNILLLIVFVLGESIFAQAQQPKEIPRKGYGDD
jgi:hypothetical protein